jgi:hypothetical protein
MEWSDTSLPDPIVSPNWRRAAMMRSGSPICIHWPAPSTQN